MQWQTAKRSCLKWKVRTGTWGWPPNSTRTQCHMHAPIHTQECTWKYTYTYPSYAHIKEGEKEGKKGGEGKEGKERREEGREEKGKEGKSRIDGDTCKIRAREAETRWGSLASQPSLISTFQGSERPHQKEKIGKYLRNYNRGCHLLFPLRSPYLHCQRMGKIWGKVLGTPEIVTEISLEDIKALFWQQWHIFLIYQFLKRNK